MEWLLLSLTGGGGGAYAVQRLRLLSADRRQAAEDLESARRMAEEDATVLGEQLARLDAEVAGRKLDEATRQDYQEALDAYETATRQASGLRSPDDISAVTYSVADGRYAVACVRARVAGRQVPARRVPCFFNPQHGLSTHDVEWTPPRKDTRTVAACLQCAARVAAGGHPDVRTPDPHTWGVPYRDTPASRSRARRPFADGHDGWA